MLLRALCMVLLFAVACKGETGGGRYISENDTTFSQDIRDISRKINADKGNATLYYNRGNAFFYQDRYSDAVIDLDYAVQLDSNNPVYHHRLGESLLRMDSADSRKARIHLEKAVQLKPDFTEAQFTLAKYYLARQEYARSFDIFKKLTGNQELADKAFLYLGIGTKEQKDTTNAVLYFEKAILVNPQNYEAAMQIALIKAHQKDSKALDYFDRALAINEYSDEAFYGKGLYLQQLGRYKDAFQHYEKARSINPGHVLATYNLAVLYNLFEEYAKAEEMCNRVIDLNEYYDNAYALRGFTFEKRGNKKAALKDYSAALKINPSNTLAKTGIDAIGNL